MLSAAAAVAAALAADCTFSTNVTGYECQGLQSNAAKSAADCEAACCAAASCTTWQWCDPGLGKACASGGGGCWIGAASGCSTKSSHWQGGQRVPPVGTVTATLPKSIPAPTPVPFELGPSTSPSGHTISADSAGFLIDGKRWFPTSGEIHFARVPASRWKEELMKMRGGGLDMVNVYIFWIHHEEVEGVYNWTGRRDLRKFLSIAKDLGLRVHLRIGPWDHGECRNGGHPDWLVQKSKRDFFRLRNNNTKYMSYAAGWYAEVSKMLNGTYFSDGGPVVAAQLDNESPDLTYLLQLRTVAHAAGILPPVYTKTASPPPSSPYPSGYPLLPFVGGYPDRFWTNDMHSDPSTYAYAFGKPSSKRVYPYFSIELGAGMAVAYNHRVHMQAEDMPSLHLVDIANGINLMGYYMYHGGNNPHSVHGDAPEDTLQESSFQPAGAANPMPSLSYDFFAPLGEFGQPRRHYHQMRRLHLLVRDYGAEIAPMPLSSPDSQPAGFGDTSTLRWAVRSNGTAGFLFVNNYQRLTDMPAKTDARFSLTLASGEKLLIPSPNSSAVTVAPSVWFVWPFNFAAADGITLRWATAQLLCSAAGVHVFAATDGVAPEIAFSADATVKHAAGTVTTEGSYSVLRNTAVGTGAALTLSKGSATVSIVILPASLADSVWKIPFAGAERVIISDASLVVYDPQQASAFNLRSEASKVTVRMLPSPGTLHAGGAAVTGSADGEFTAFTFDMPTIPAPAMTVTQRTPAGPPRNIPVSRAGKAEEPTAKDWEAAAVYDVTGNASVGSWQGELRLAVDYEADAARIYLGDTLLTDNWMSGYKGDGAMEVGLTYLAGENPGLQSEHLNLTLKVLPLRKDALQKNVFIQQRLWPDFGTDSSVLRVNSVRSKLVNYLQVSV
eukprot:TRINITY_DN137_c2_g1_i1.p1 TRINITY_DN137_c2_g1~~TRINITY_DN137_c2_g1_i1.p1  ORF type:complete len:915 (+),score=325.46 TRINITY_DN137_c2_g1_i1:66-2747(+)